MAYVEGALGPDTREAIDAHVDACPECAALVAHAVREAGVVASHGEETPLYPSSAWSEQPLPARVGRYVILERIGRGGMGIVCAGYDPRLRRKVAVKLLRPDLHDPDAGARLRREARALATLSHPNVVSVFECGALHDRDGDYLVMELVAGETLRRFCSRTRPSSSAIIDAYLAAARGLAAAHAAGLVHRDFKPDNVLVGFDGRVCVTDFGLAREVRSVTSPGESSSPFATSVSDDAGTPLYMAPEQRDGSSVSPASDQYAFCVSLWESLAGAVPPIGDAKRVPSRVRAVLQRGLSVTPSERWPDMDALARGLVRTRRATLARSVVALAGIATLVGVAQWAMQDRGGSDSPCVAASRRMDELWSADRRAAVAELARSAGAPEVLAVLDDRSEAWRARAAQACVDEPALLQDGGCLSLAAVELETLVGVLERSRALDVPLRAAAHDLAAPDACARTTPARIDADAAAVVRDRMARATALEVAHRFEGARSLAAEAVMLARGADDALLAEALRRESEILHAAGDYPAEAERAEEALVVAESAGLDEIAAAVATKRVFTASQIENDFPAAKTWARHAAAAIERMPADARELARARLVLAEAHIAQGEGRLEEATRDRLAAIEVLERFDDVSASELSAAYNDHGTLLIERDPETALASFGHALALVRAHYGDAHPRAAMLLNNIATVHYYRGDFAPAARIFEEATRLLETIFGEHHHDVAGAYMNLAMVQDELGDQLAARASMSRALEIFRVSLGPDHPDLAVARTNVGAFELESGDLDAAEAEFRQALAALEATVGPDHLYCTNALRGLAEVALARGHAGDAVALHERALAIDAKHGLAPFEMASQQLALAEAQARAGDREQGEATVRAAIAALAGDDAGGDAQARAELMVELGAWLQAPVNAAAAGSG